MTGPVEYVVLALPEYRSTGSLAPALADLVGNGFIRVLDFVVIERRLDGTVTCHEFEEIDELSAFADVDGEVGGLIGLDDVEYVSQGLAKGSSVVLLIWEDIWAEPLLDALRAANGELVEGARVPHDLVDAAMTDAG
jgi:hypothetical protein